MLDLQPSVAQEVEREVRMAVDASTAATERGAQLVEIRRADVRELRAFDVSPDRLHGIEFRGIARQALDSQPAALARQVVAHHATPMSWESIPDQDRRLSPEVAAQITQEGDQHPIGVAARLRLKEEP